MKTRKHTSSTRLERKVELLNAFTPPTTDQDKYIYYVDKDGRKFYGLRYRMDSKVDMQTGDYITISDPRYEASELPTVNELKANKVLSLVDELFIDDIYIDSITGPTTGIRSEEEIEELGKEISAKFKEKLGLEIPPEAFYHNLGAWMRNFKSAYVYNEKYHFFTPCGDNRFRIGVEKFVGAEWQETYIS